MKDKFTTWEYFKEDTPIVITKSNKPAILVKYYEYN